MYGRAVCRLRCDKLPVAGPEVLRRTRTRIPEDGGRGHITGVSVGAANRSSDKATGEPMIVRSRDFEGVSMAALSSADIDVSCTCFCKESGLSGDIWRETAALFYACTHACLNVQTVT